MKTQGSWTSSIMSNLHPDEFEQKEMWNGNSPNGEKRQRGELVAAKPGTGPYIGGKQQEQARQGGRGEYEITCCATGQ